MVSLENMTIKKRLTGGLGIIIAFMVVLIGIGTWSLPKHQQQIKPDCKCQ
jgi:CHASE3 domain sensor protein